MYKRNGGWVAAVLMSLIFLVTTAPGWAAEKNAGGEKIALVNGKIIPRADFDFQMAGINAQIAQTGKTPTSAEISDIKKKVLENLIYRELLYQESQKEGIKVDEKNLNEQFESWKKQFPSQEEVTKYLKQLNQTETGFKNEGRKDIAIQQFLEKKFGQKASVSDQETKTFYDSNQALFKVPEQVHASHILIKVDPKAEATQKAAARKKIEDIQKQLKNGGAFAELAKKNSDCPSKANGGDLGFFSRGQMVKPFEDTAFSLKSGETSGIVETEFGFHLIKVIEKKPESTVPYDQVKAKIAEKLKNKKIENDTRPYVEQLKSNAKIERFLKEG